MNKYQRKLHREVKAKQRDIGTVYGYKVIKKLLKFHAKHQYFSPCENCDNPTCREPKNKLVYCRNNM